MMAERDDRSMEKNLLRAEMLGRMSSMADVARRTASAALSERLLEIEELRMASVILGYIAMRSEIDPSSALIQCLRDGVRVAVPVVDEESKELEAVEVDSLDPRRFKRDRFGVLVPSEGERVRATELDVVLVPGVAFDRCGRRLGRGAGFYDRLLVRLPERCRTIGAGFAYQVVDTVPTDDRDRRVQVVATDAEVVEADLGPEG